MGIRGIRCRISPKVNRAHSQPYIPDSFPSYVFFFPRHFIIFGSIPQTEAIITRFQCCSPQLEWISKTGNSTFRLRGRTSTCRSRGREVARSRGDGYWRSLSGNFPVGVVKAACIAEICELGRPSLRGLALRNRINNFYSKSKALTSLHIYVYYSLAAILYRKDHTRFAT